MTSKHKRLAYAAGGFGFIVVLGWNLVSSSPTSTPLVPAPKPSVTAPSLEASSPSPFATVSPGLGAAARTDEVDYAIAVTELSGLSPDAAPGTLLDLWVAWDPPITDEPHVQPLLRSVRLTRIVAPVTPEGPAVALLSIRPSQVSDIIYGDRYGALSVTMFADGS